MLLTNPVIEIKGDRAQAHVIWTAKPLLQFRRVEQAGRGGGLVMKGCFDE